MLICIIVLCMVSQGSATTGYTKISEWWVGDFPQYMTINSSDCIFITVPNEGKVKYFDPSGSQLGEWIIEGFPWGISVDPGTGNVYVADYYKHQVQYFNSSGFFLGKWGSYGKGDGQFNCPTGIFASPGTVYVTDTGNNRIEFFDMNGRYKGQWGKEGKDILEYKMPGAIIKNSYPGIYVADENNYRIQANIFDTSGPLSTAGWGKRGDKNGQFQWISGIATDSAGLIYISDKAQNRIQYFSSKGKYLGSITDDFSFPQSVAINSKNYVYVLNSGLNKVEVYKKT